MPFAELLGALRRKWILLAIGLLLTGGLSAGSYMVTKPIYEITATVLLLPPSSALTAAGNPYLQLGGLRQTVDLVGVALSDQNTRTELEAISKDVEYTVAADSQTSSPILVVDVKDSTQAGATQIRDLLVARIPDRLRTMQESLNVVTANRVTSTLLTSDNEAKEVGRNRLRSAVVVGLGGLALTLAVISLLDARRPGKARRNAKAPVRAEEPRRTEEADGAGDPDRPVSLDELDPLTEDPAEIAAPSDGPVEFADTDELDETDETDDDDEYDETDDFDETDEPYDLEEPYDLGELDATDGTTQTAEDAESSLALVTDGEPEDVEV